MLSICAYNVNGIRSNVAKGFLRWVRDERPDILCMQEIRLDDEGLFRQLTYVPGYQSEAFPALKKGYAGTATLWREKAFAASPALTRGFGVEEFDGEGRTLVSRFEAGPDRLCLVNLYAPSGSAGPHRQASKDRWLAAFFPWARRLSRKEGSVLFVGDFNIAHHEIDIARPKENEGTSGFLPHERAWLDGFQKAGFVDVVRTLAPDRRDLYTWWSQRSGAYERNVGWRIDYHWASPDLARRAKGFSIDRAHRGSDHAPLTVRYAV